MKNDPAIQLPFFVIAWRPATAPAQLMPDRGELYLTVSWRAPLGGGELCPPPAKRAYYSAEDGFSHRLIPPSTANRSISASSS
jgi:hypothetical protein